MRVKLAKSAGFCMGVRRAMNAVIEAANKSDQTIYTLGPLVHNRQAIEMLGAKNVKIVSSAEETESGTLFIRAHGVTPEVRESLGRPGLAICDMTCPHVRRAQLIIERHAKKGYATIIIGDEGHAEVVGLLGHADGRGYVVGAAEDIARIPQDLERVCVVAQTTQNAQRFDELLPLLEQRFPGLVVHNTVCSATDSRQTEVRALAREVDAMIVVGGKHSANTVRLAEIARGEGLPTFHIETAGELDPDAIRHFKTLGITGGASTPHWVFRAVVDKANHCLQTRSVFIRLPRDLVALLVHTYFYIGAGSAALTYAALRLLDIAPRFSYLLVSCLYVVSMHILNRFTDRAAARMNDPHRMRLIEQHPRIFMSAVVLFALTSLIIASTFGLAPCVLVFLSLLAGVSYNLRLIPPWLARKIRFKAFREIPGSKDLFTALAWAVVSVLVPCLAVEGVQILPALYVFFFGFTMVFIRSLVFDMKDLEGDRILGKETFPLIMGPKATNRLIALCTVMLALIAVSDVFFTWSAVRGYLLLPVAAYVCFYLVLYYRNILSRGILFEIALDAQFVLMGLLAYCIPYDLYNLNFRTNPYRTNPCRANKQGTGTVRERFDQKTAQGGTFDARLRSRCTGRPA